MPAPDAFDARPINAEEAAALLRGLRLRRDAFGQYTIPWERYEATIARVRFAQEETAAKAGE